jgi:hypothetical protein
MMHNPVLLRGRVGVGGHPARIKNFAKAPNNLCG